MNKLLNLSALLVFAAVPALALAATALPASTLVLAGENAVAVIATLGVLFAFAGDYAREARPLPLPVTRTASRRAPARRRNAYTFRRGADVARLAPPPVPSLACRRAIALAASRVN